jgi:DNA ligase-associated metallophosphoesterase
MVTLGPLTAVADRSGVLWCPSESLLVVSDLHFEKGSHYAERGVLLPPYDTRATLSGLEAAIRRYRPRRVLSLGDAFHDPQAERRMDAADAARLEAICRAVDFIWVLGNHDPLPPVRFCGTAEEVAVIGGAHFVHEPGAVEDWHAAGHLHPAAAIAGTGRRLRRRCFAVGQGRVVLPAFGAYTGGLNVLDRAFQAVMPEGVTAVVLGEKRVYRMPRGALRHDGEGRAAPSLRRVSRPGRGR